MGDRNMGREELEALLLKARDVLYDVEETFEFTCANTNDHIADAMINQFDEELAEGRAEVARLEELLEEFE
ncbi:MAG: hypothetical protein KAR83_03555 [Thermodesulfovibrionales bacterium]|nr:hypothetical protein [Thermodesulfovibrionales bacterium]